MLLLTLAELAARAADDTPQGFTLGEIWHASGTIARTVIILLCVMMLACIYVALERLIAFNRARAQSMQLAAEIIGPLQQGDVSAAKTLAEDEKFASAYLGSILKSGLGELENRLDDHGIDNAHRDR